MSDLYRLHQKSGPVVVVPYRPEWPAEFLRRARAMRAALDDSVLRIDHIGSTSVPGLAAKDIIDVQVTVRELDDNEPWAARFNAAGYQPRPDIQSDHSPPWFQGDPREWKKRYVREPATEQRTHIHIRAAGRQNQRFALLFRDFLRAQPRFATTYGLIKQRLSELFPESIDNYLYVKDPAVDLIIAAAEEWAKATQWAQGPSDA
jgi:GrpB-like predicted nucleotidyltransferase (UPF0157 family)